MRLKGVLSYKGTNFFGYQIQKDSTQRSVQKEIQDVLKRIFNSEIKIFSSGRTDRGVHAVGQVIHFDIEKEVYKAGRFREKGIPNPVSQFKIYLISFIFESLKPMTVPSSSTPTNIVPPSLLRKATISLLTSSISSLFNSVFHLQNS